MERLTRNSLFLEKEYMIRQTMGKHRVLLISCNMNTEDVYQELAIRLLEALEKYDARRCGNMDAYLMLQLRYKLWNLIDCSKRFGVPQAPKRGFSVLSLQSPDRYGNEREIPSEDDRGDPVWIEREITALPESQKSVLERLLSGRRVAWNNKALADVRGRLRVLVGRRHAAIAA